jgi:hypothetical protein
MNIPTRVPLGRLLWALIVLAILLVVLNPELRVLVFFVNAVGFDIAVLLLLLQLRVAHHTLAPTLDSILAFGCNLTGRVGYAALCMYPAAVALRRLNRLLCPVLIAISYGLRCRAIRQAL